MKCALLLACVVTAATDLAESLCARQVNLAHDQSVCDQAADMKASCHEAGDDSHLNSHLCMYMQMSVHEKCLGMKKAAFKMQLEDERVKECNALRLSCNGLPCFIHANAELHERKKADLKNYEEGLKDDLLQSSRKMSQLENIITKEYQGQDIEKSLKQLDTHFAANKVDLANQLQSLANNINGVDVTVPNFLSALKVEMVHSNEEGEVDTKSVLLKAAVPDEITQKVQQEQMKQQEDIARARSQKLKDLEESTFASTLKSLESDDNFKKQIQASVMNNVGHKYDVEEIDQTMKMDERRNPSLAERKLRHSKRPSLAEVRAAAMEEHETTSPIRDLFKAGKNLAIRFVKDFSSAILADSDAA